MLTVGSLFAGIGGFDLGLERAGMQVKWQVEIDPYCLKVLEKHWPYVRRYTDIKTVDWSGVEPVDLVCGGFPCQPVSVAGKRKGTADERWLWPEFARCLRLLRPRYVILENVPGLLTANDGRACAEVLDDLSASGYEFEWQIISAAAVGAPHLRRRLWIVAYAASICRYERLLMGSNGWSNEAEQVGMGCQNVSDTERQRCEEQWSTRAFETGTIMSGSWWSSEPNVGRVAYGVPARAHRLRGLGNAVVPQVVEWIGRQILQAEESLV